MKNKQRLRKIVPQALFVSMLDSIILHNQLAPDVSFVAYNFYIFA